MEFVNATFLGIVQGLTEFIPVSSSGHLIIARQFLGEQVAYGLAFDAVLQLATTFAVLVYFWKDITGYIATFFAWVLKKDVSKEQKTLLTAIIVGSIPAGIFGFLFENVMETLFRNPLLVAASLLGGAAIMFFAERAATQTKTLTTKRGFQVGLFQALALVPGFSRSGMTISGGLFIGLTREAATRFSFLLAFPILLGSGLKKLLDLFQEGLLGSVGLELIVGSLAAFVVGLAAIHFLVSYLKKNTLMVFVWYRVVLACLVLFLFA